ncbi:(+)-neomenthol dehydrogenase-like [Ananas comosus]|uniref:Short-chain dehydrogenase/reductase n=2 Tax=Ananas comosus TaxID=4615 RepID=A0A6P5EG45_ANACO|nr:(+)-neomenthol dehydrogenase-like [Ananas comosus]CAD1844425.1 unnamed protein product [Ananas comosus var. bracteatus]
MENPLPKPTPNKVALVTGANKGIGLEICRRLLSSQRVTVVLTARDEGRGVAAVQKLRDSRATTGVFFHQLDVADSSSVASLADFVRAQFGKLDILVNNAGVLGRASETQGLAGESTNSLPAGETYEKAEECLETNYYGTKRVTEALIPLLLKSQSPRIVNISSYYGKLQRIPNEGIQKEIGDIDSLTEEKIDEMVRSFLNDFKEGKLRTNNWPARLSAYTVSKVAMSAYTRIIAKKYPAICTNCVQPGYVKTDLNANSGILSVEEGAEGPVMLALLPDGSPSGLFYDQTKVSSFVA